MLYFLLMFIGFFGTTQTQIYGPQVFEFGGILVKNTKVSDDGEMMVAALNNRSILVFKNDKSTFVYEQSFRMPGKPIDLIISHNKTYIGLTSKKSKLLLYEKGVDGIYAEILRINTSATYSFMEMTKDENYLTFIRNAKYITMYKKINGTFTFQSEIYFSVVMLRGISITDDARLIATGGLNGYLYIIENINGTLTLRQSILQSFYPTQLKIDEQKLLVSGYSNQILLYEFNGTQYTLSETLVISQDALFDIGISEDFSTLVFGQGNLSSIYKRINGTYQEEFSNNVGAGIAGASIQETLLYYMFYDELSSSYLYFKCPQECSNCSFPNNCTSCSQNFVLKGITCVPKPTHCVQNKFVTGNICQEYCHTSCKTCNQTKYDCYQCAKFYTKNNSGKCSIYEDDLNFLVLMTRPFLNIFRRKGLKFVFMVVDDLWLYNFHKQRYDGIAKEIFITIKFIEDRQWQIVQLSKTKDQIQSSIQVIDDYDPFSNPTYIFKERKNDAFIDSTYTYFSFFVPFTLISVFIFNKIFYLLFNYEISKYLRPYSFNWIVFELMVMNNIQFFTFLGFRTFQTSFSFDFPSKMLLVLAIGMFFLVFLGTFTGYAHYYATYKKFARYFLVNMFRFPSSYCLMMLCFGVRPFLKGVIHALLYDNWVLQIYLLMAVQIIILALTLYFQFNYDSHKSALIFMMDSSYSVSLIMLNVLILLKYEYLKEYENVVKLLESCTEVIVYFMIIMLLIRVVWELVPWSWFKNKEKDEQQSENQEKNSKQLVDQMKKNQTIQKNDCLIEVNNKLVRISLNEEPQKKDKSSVKSEKIKKRDNLEVIFQRNEENSAIQEIT